MKVRMEVVRNDLKRHGKRWTIYKLIPWSAIQSRSRMAERTDQSRKFNEN